MALTNAERQAALKARREETTRMLAEQNAALLAENAELRTEVAALREKTHRLEVSALKAQLKQVNVRASAAPQPADKQATAGGPGKPPKRAARTATKQQAKP